MEGKIIGYKSVGGILLLNRIIYIIYGRQIVFSGLHNSRDGRVGSTINFAEEVILAIAVNEKIDPKSHEFFDLQTHKGYCSYKPGDYTLNMLHPVWDGLSQPVGMGWTEGHPDPQILKDFSECIWGSVTPSTPRNLSIYHGHLKPLEAERLSLC